MGICTLIRFKINITCVDLVKLDIKIISFVLLILESRIQLL